MSGISAKTGGSVGDFDHLRQSVRDILTTPIGTRIMRRDYGSRLFDLIDSNINDGTLIRVYAAAAQALHRWEPRFRLHRVSAEILPEDAVQGKISLSFQGEYLIKNGNNASLQPIHMEGLVI